jgi:hypothetical protein
MPTDMSHSTKAAPLYRCAGPNCGRIKTPTDRWWLMWTSLGSYNRPVLYMCSWDEKIALEEVTFHVCGELCAQRLQSQFMGNIRKNELRRERGLPDEEQELPSPQAGSIS